MPDIQDKLKTQLKDGDTFERCGFITKRGKIVEVKNVAPNPAESFKIDPKDTIQYTGKGVVATWHTHPSSGPNLSGEDYNCFLSWDDLRHYIVGRQSGVVRVKEYAIEDGLVVVK